VPPGPADASGTTAELAAAPVPPDSVGRSLAFLSGATAVQLVGNFLQSLVLRAILGPAKTGVWNLVEVWRTQLSSVSIGASFAADRDMPVLRARGQRQDEDEVRSVAFSFTLGEASVVALGFIVYWAVERDGFEPSLALGLALVPVMSVLTSYVSLYHLFLKNLKEFRLYATLLAVQVAIDWSALPLVLLGGLDALLIGLAAGWVLRALIHYVAVRRRRLFRLRFTVRRAVLVPMLRFGALLSVVGLLQQLLLRLDSLVIGISLGTTPLGYYFLGPQVAVAVAAVPLSLTVIAWPNLMETYGRGGRESMLPHLERYLRPIGLVVSPIVTAAGVFGVAVIVNGFLPDFARGLDAMQVFILTVVFVHSVTLLHQVLIAVKRIVLLLALTAAGVVVQATILVLGSIDGLALTTAAWSAVAGQATMALGMLVASIRLLDVERHDVLRLWARVPLVWALAIALIVGLDELAPDTSGTVQAIGLAAVQFVAFIALLVPIVLLADRHVLRESRALLRGHG
jgi:O-antigen/teichoic acid export membrane protein